MQMLPYAIGKPSDRQTAWNVPHSFMQTLSRQWCAAAESSVACKCCYVWLRGAQMFLVGTIDIHVWGYAQMSIDQAPVCEYVSMGLHLRLHHGHAVVAGQQLLHNDGQAPEGVLLIHKQQQAPRYEVHTLRTNCD